MRVSLAECAVLAFLGFAPIVTGCGSGPTPSREPGSSNNLGSSGSGGSDPTTGDDSGISSGSSSSSSGGSPNDGFTGSSSGGFSGGFGVAPQPTFGPTVHAPTPPPVISGGTLLVTGSGAVVASDPDRDALYVVDTTGSSLRFAISLQPGDEPGRLAEDGAGRVHVALRHGGALVTVNPASGAIVARRPACPAPRGVAWDPQTDLVWVACATGELVAFPSAGGAAVRSFVLERDLRDVVVQADSLVVSKFRSAEILRVTRTGTITRRDSQVSPALRSPHVAWRTIPGPLAGSTITVHQNESTQAIATTFPGGYAGSGGFGCGSASSSSSSSSSGSSGGVTSNGCPSIDLEAGAPPDFDAGPGSAPIAADLSGPIVTSAVTVLDASGTWLGSAPIDQGVLPVDVALSRDGTFVAVALAGNGFGPLPSIALVSLDSSSAWVPNITLTNEQVTAVAFDASGNFLAQTREPARLLVFSATRAVQSIALSTISRDDTGHDIFHTQAGGLMACASCHPEGGDDGHTWSLDGLPRRTPSLCGTIAGTAPYHWPGDEKDMNTLLDDVYTGRMSGAQLDSTQEGAIASWVESIPAPPAPSWIDRAAALLGQALFRSGATRCTACHSGLKLTNNATVDVGTGHDVRELVPEDAGAPVTAFQVPPLVGVGWRMPILHDGCAATMLDRFGKCATTSHGTTEQLSQSQVADMVAYLESL